MREFYILMKYLGIDYGTREVGVSISDDRGTIAFPRITLVNDDDLIKTLIEMIIKENVEQVVIGDTRALSGAENVVTKEADAFAVALETASKIPVVRAWEAWSSFEAARFAPKGSTHDNAAAAAIILQRYLDMRGSAIE